MILPMYKYKIKFIEKMIPSQLPPMRDNDNVKLAIGI